MAKVGYIFNSEQYDTFTFDRAWMEKYGCCRIIEDSASQEKTRPEWKQLMDCLERGDELVISNFCKISSLLSMRHTGYRYGCRTTASQLERQRKVGSHFGQ